MACDLCSDVGESEISVDRLISRAKGLGEAFREWGYVWEVLASALDPQNPPVGFLSALRYTNQIYFGRQWCLFRAFWSRSQERYSNHFLRTKQFNAEQRNGGNLVRQLLAEQILPILDSVCKVVLGTVLTRW